MRNLRQRGGVVLASCAALLAVPLHPAAAQGGVHKEENPVEFRDSGTCTGPRGAFQIAIRGNGEEVLKIHERGAGTPLPFSDVHVTLRTTYTNPATGLSWTSLDVFHEHDVKVLEVNGDIVTMQVLRSFKFIVYDPSGEIDSYDRGMSAFVIDIDTQGTANPEDDKGTFVEELFSAGPRHVRDFCEDAIRFTLR